MLIGRERDLSLLSLVCRANTDNIADRIPECPVSLLIFVSLDQLCDLQVCFERFRGQSQVFQCEQGHFICGDCRPRVQVSPPVHYKYFLTFFSPPELSHLQGKDAAGQMPRS